MKETMFNLTKRKVIDANVKENPLLHRAATLTDLEKGFKIAKKLFKTLKPMGNGIGLAANQIGLDYNVAVIDPKKYNSSLNKIILINPRVIKMSGATRFSEGCLSYPEKVVTTTRFTSITLECYEGKGIETFRGMSAIAIQHEIDHLNGVTIFSRERKPIEVEKPIGRNQTCPCESGKKYKRCCMKRRMK